MPRTAMEGYAQEPNMSFVRAIVVVAVLHLVAVGGIYAFSSLKLRNIGQQNPPPRPAKETTAAPAETGNAGDASSKTSPPAARQIQAPANVSAGQLVAPVKPAAGANTAEQAVKPPVGETGTSVKDSGAFYTVAKGDTPVSIAKKLRVGYDDLLKLNKITDPKKLKIGQKLRIPAKKKTTPQT